jgi:hypothetical protein
MLFCPGKLKSEVKIVLAIESWYIIYFKVSVVSQLPAGIPGLFQNDAG